MAPWAPTLTPWSAKPPPRARGGGTEAARGGPGITPFHLPWGWTSPNLTHTCEAKGSKGGTSWKPGAGGEAGLVGTDPPQLLEQIPPSTPAQQAGRSKIQPNPKANTGRQTQVTPTGQRSPEAPAQTLHKTSPGTEDAAPAPAGSGGGSKSLSVQLQVSKEDVGTRLRLLAASFFFFFFKLSFINNI